MASVTELFEESLKKQAQTTKNHGRFKWRLWLGPSASLLCLIHCFTVPVILALAPGLVSFVPHEALHPLEFAFWILAAPLGFFTLKNASLSRTWLWSFVAISIPVPVSLILETSQNITHAFFIAMTTFQLVGVIKAHFFSRKAPHAPHCCDGHDH